jgi:2-phosphoglycerate kinase
MLYLIGGPPRCGKTTLAELLAKEKSIPYFPIDHITSVLTPYIPAHEHESALPLSIARKATNYSNDIFYAKYAPQQIVGFYLQQADTYWPGVENFIKYALTDEHDLILEGWPILPAFIHAVSTPANQAKLKIVLLYKLDRAAIVAGLKANTAKLDWVIRHTKDEATYRAIAEMISQFGSYIEAEAKKYNLAAVNTDFAFQRKIADALKILL